MKKFLSIAGFLLLIVFPGTAQTKTQSDVPIDSILTTLQRINSILDEKNYTRIPNKEFDDKINLAVSKDIDSRWKNMLALFAGIGGILLVFGFNYFRRELNSKVKEETKKDIEEKIKSMNELMDKKFKELTDSLTEKISHVYLTTVKSQYENQIWELENLYQKKIDILDAKTREFDLQMMVTNSNIIRSEIDKIKKAGLFTQEEYNTLKGYIPRVEQMNDNRLLAELINELSRAAYYNKREHELQGLFDKYMDKPDVEIKENSFINIAAGMFYNYASSKEKEIKEKAFKYINKSLTKVSDYGEALGLKLEFLMVDLEIAASDSEKNKIRREVALIIDQAILSHYASKEVIARFERVNINPTEKKYIDMLKKEFPVEMVQLETAGKKQTPASSTPGDLN